MNGYWSKPSPEETAPEYGDEVKEVIDSMTYSQLRYECEIYRSIRKARNGGRPFGFRFGDWLRDRVETNLVCGYKAMAGD